MRIAILTLVLAFVLGLSSCANQNLNYEKNNYGSPPTNYEEQIKAYLSRSLFDPYSADVRIGTPYPGKHWLGLVRGGNIYGYVVDAQVNAKNRFGAYVGFRTYSFLFQNGTIANVYQK